MNMAIASRLCTESSPAEPLFFIGSSPSMASRIISPDHPAAGVMVSIGTLRNRKSKFSVSDWIMDSGAFTEITQHGAYRFSVYEYFEEIVKWSKCGNLLIAVSQDWMCEPFALNRTGLTIADHQRLTIERYDSLVRLDPGVPIMPVLQGYRSSDYVSHLQQYGDRLRPDQWVGVGSVCRRNGSPDEVADLLRGVKLLRPDIRLHGFGLKILALENTEVRSFLYSCDSMAWSYPLRFRPSDDSVHNRNPIKLAHKYQEKIAVVGDNAPKRIPRTAGAGNGQGRKPKWKSPSKPIRVPRKYAERLILLAHEWEQADEHRTY